MIHAARCVICGRALFRQAASVHSGAIGPTCARKLGLGAKRRARAAVKVRATAPERDPRQVDWVEAAA